MAQAPKRFLVWFEGGNVDQAATAKAVQAWAEQQRQSGNSLEFDQLGSTEFEVQDPLPGVPLDAGAVMTLKVTNKDPSKLFEQDGVLLYPEW